MQEKKEVGPREEQRPLGRPKLRWRDVRMGLREIEWGKYGLDAPDGEPVAGFCEHGSGPLVSIKGRELD
jgi:hypothetical protein